MFAGYYKSSWDKSIGKPVYKSNAGAYYLPPNGNRKTRRYLFGEELKDIHASRNTKPSSFISKKQSTND